MRVAGDLVKDGEYGDGDLRLAAGSGSLWNEESAAGRSGIE